MERGDTEEARRWGDSEAKTQLLFSGILAFLLELQVVVSYPPAKNKSSLAFLQFSALLDSIPQFPSAASPRNKNPAALLSDSIRFRGAAIPRRGDSAARLGRVQRWGSARDSQKQIENMKLGGGTGRRKTNRSETRQGSVGSASRILLFPSKSQDEFKPGDEQLQLSIHFWLPRLCFCAATGSGVHQNWSFR